MPPQSPWYAAPPPAYAPPPAGYYGWVPPTNPAVNQAPPPNSVFMTDSPPPYPGIGSSYGGNPGAVGGFQHQPNMSGEVFL